MVPEWLERTKLLVGAQGMEQLRAARVAVIGLGGVGGAAAEALGRAGVGHLLLVDHDTVEPSNLNRQLLATRLTIGTSKAQAAVDRLRTIDPEGDYTAAKAFYMPDNRAFLLDWSPAYVVDAIDTVTAKLDLACVCRERGIELVSCMGTGNRLDPSLLRMGDISETANGSGCGLARVMRRELRRRGIGRQAVLYSLEPPAAVVCPDSAHGRHTPGSAAFVPPAAGFLLASYLVRQILGALETEKG